MSMPQHTVTRAATVMFLYAALLIALGVLAYLIAPPGAKAGTAVIVTSVCAVAMIAMGVMALLVHRKRKIGIIGIHVGLLLPLLFGATFLWRAGESYRASGVYQYFENAYIAEVQAGTFRDAERDRTAFLSGARPKSAKEIPAGDKGYLGFILTMLFGISVAAFVVLLLSRPKLPPKQAKVPPVVTKPAKETAAPSGDAAAESAQKPSAFD